ncbi:uncharacterized protein [Narcine bancroftii]|uniref:uncharacterized protein n=1 Tax=Narcine bancroftii TaxID=1343680 RepID=UPI003831A798
MGQKMICEWICPLTLIVILTSGSLVNTFVCDVDIPDGQRICESNNSTLLESQLQSGNIDDFCNYTVLQYACAQCDVLEQLTIENLTSIFKCFAVTRPVNIFDLNATALFTQKFSLSKLENLLDMFNREVNDTMAIPLMAKETILQAIWERYKDDLKISNSTFLDAFLQLLQPFIAGISQPILQSLQYSNIVCENFKTFVQGFNVSLNEMSLTTKAALDKWIFGYINVTGVDCITNTSESRDWLLKYWGVISDFMHSENLTNATSRPISTTVIQNETIRDTLLSSIFGTLKPLFPVFTPTNFSNWFQRQLPPLLPAITDVELASIPTNITCESYQAIVKGFDSVFPNLLDSQFSQLFKFGKNIMLLQLNSSGTACSSNMTGSREWIKNNFINSLKGVKLNDLLALNKNFSGFEVLDLLTPELLAELTVSSEAWFNADKIGQIVDKLKDLNFSNLLAYFIQFNYDTYMMNITAFENTTGRDLMLRKVMQLLKPFFSSFNASDYAEWFQERLFLLLPSVTEKELAMIPTNISCEGYQAIMKGLDNLYLNLSLSQQNEIHIFSKRILKFQQDFSGSLGIGCAGNSNGIREWTIKNFFRFISQLNFNELIDLNKNFSAFEILDLFSAKQLSELTVSLDVLNNTDKISKILNDFRNRNFSDLVNYINYFNLDAQVVDITSNQNAVVRDLMLQIFFDLLGPYFPIFKPSDYIDWFQNKLNLLLFSVKQTELDTIPTNITCESYQAIVKGLDNVYSNLSKTQQEDIFNFIVKYLTHQLNLTASACTANTKGSIPWLLINFGKFRSFLVYKNFLVLNKNFIGLSAREFLTVAQLGQLAGNNGTLQTIRDVQKILSLITRDTVTEFIDAFSIAVNQSHVAFTSDVGATLLEKVLNLSQSILSKANDTELQFWLDSRLQALLPSLTAKTVPMVFVSQTCNGFQIIVTILNSIKKLLDVKVQEAIYEAILTFDKVFPLLCYKNNSFVVYLQKHYQSFFEFLTLRDTFLHIPSDRLAQVLNTINPSDFADLLSRPRFIDDNKFLIIVLTHYMSSQSLETFVDNFNLKSQASRLTGDNRAAFLKVFWTYFATVVLAENNDTEVEKWLNVRLQPYLPFITTDLLISNVTLGIPCLPYRKIVRTLNARYTDLTPNERDIIYNGIKVYLQKGPKPKCYDPNDTALNSTAWFINYLGLFMNQMSLIDLHSFFDNEAQIQVFVANVENQALLENLMLSPEVSRFFINLLVKNDSGFNISSLPNSLVCLVGGTDLIASLNEQQTLTLIERVNDVCGLSTSPNRTSDAAFLTDERRKLSILLVNKFDNFSVSTLNTLGQTSVGLSFSQIKSIDGDSLKEALPSLSKVKGWNLGQARIIVNKLLSQNFQVNNIQNLQSLGSLVSGIPSNVFKRIDPEVFKGLYTQLTFVENIGAAPQPIRMIFVLQILRSEEDPRTIVKNIPSVLAKEIPPSLLNSDLMLEDVNNKQWVPSQAAVFFERIVKTSNNYGKFSPSVLQGFSCGAVKTLNFSSFIELVQAMKEKRAVLDESQGRCIYFIQNSQRRPPALDAFPDDVLLNFNSANFRKSENCKTFFKAVGKANIDILPKGSSRRQNLLDDALTCLKMTGYYLTKDSVTILGGLVCDLSGSVISESDISILDELKNCISYSESQRSVIEVWLKSGNTRYGTPSSWSSATIYELGNLPLTLTYTWKEVNETVINEALPGFIKKIKSWKSPSDVLVFIKQLDLQESDNLTNCTKGLITAVNINDLTPAIYNMKQLDLCLSDRVLDNNVLQLGSLSFNPSQLEVLKKRLLQIYPNGLPEEQIQMLGNISTVFNATEINGWNISGVDTLSELMMPQLEISMVVSIIARYLQLGGTLNAVALKAIGGMNLCHLNESQLVISNLTDAGPLDLSTCTQSKKDFLYSLAFSILGSQQRNPIPYFNLMKPYLGGIPLEDLEVLSNNKVNMDFATFVNLNPYVVKNLTAQNLIDLLGYYIQALPSGVNETVVVIWVNSHFKSEVSRLGLPGGLPDPTPERIFCADKDSSALNNFLVNIKPEQVCTFNITEYTCAKTELLKQGLNSDSLANIFDCFIGERALNTSDEIALVIFFQKFDETTLYKALDRFNQKTPNTTRIPLSTKITFLNALWEIVKTNENLTGSVFLAKLFQERFRPFIAGISQSTVSPLLTRNLTCDAYLAVVNGLRSGFREMSPEMRRTVLREWIFNYLNTTAFALDCYENRSFVLFMKSSFLSASPFLTLKDVFVLVPPDSVSEVLKIVDPRELADLLRMPGFIDDNEILLNLLINIQSKENLSLLVTEFITKIQDDNLTDVIEGLQQEFRKRIFVINDTDVKEWLNATLIPALPLISTTLFNSNSSQSLQCLLLEKIVATLSYFKEKQKYRDQKIVHENLLAYARAFPLQCYENNSFIEYLKSYFQNYFNFLTLKDTVSLIPPRRETEVLNSIDLNELANLLSTPGFVDDQDILTKVVLRIQPLQNLTRFLDAFANATRDRNLLAAVLEGVWIWFTEGLPELTDAEVDEWLNVRLAPYLPFITTRLLVSNRTLSVSCLPYRRIVKALNAIYPKLSSEKRTEIYNGIRTYLLQGPRPKCYNASDPVLNSTAWFSQYLGLYLSQVPLSDLQSFSDDETLLQEFAANPKTLEFLENVTLMVEVATAYINLLAKNNPNFNASTVPNSLLCFIANTNLLQNLTAQQTLALIGRINNVCGRNDTTNTSTDGTLPPEQPTDEQIKLAIVLVSKIDNFSVSTLNTLGQNAIGLSSSQVDSIDENTLQQALPTLGNVQGWNIGQANSIVNNLLRSGYQVNNRSGLLAVGTLVSGIPSDVFERINPTVFINLISNVRFVQNIGQASQSIRAICVLQVLRNVNNPVATVKTIPSVLASEVPPVLLNSNLSLDDVNNKEWTPSQSAVFFPNVIRNDTNFETFSPTVLQGFSCGATKTLSFPTFLKLVQELKLKEVSLDESQLDCVAGRLSSNGTEVNLNTLPSGVLLFNYQYFRTLSTCREFFKSVGKSNRKILSKVLARERDVLKDARTCLGVTNSKNLTKETLTVLSGLVCELDGSTIMASDISVLDELKKCVTYRDDQKRAIEYRLQSGSSKYGFPSSWSSSTIRSLGYLPLALTDTWKQINKPTLYEALPRFIKKIKRSRPPGEVLIFISQLQLRGISNNTATCTEGEIAPEDISDLTPAIYRASQLDLCLSDAVLKDGVLQLGSLAFDPAQLKVLKKKLLRIYPKGLPENQIQLLGNISTVFNATEVSSWNITRVETLSALMKQQLDNTTVLTPRKSKCKQFAICREIVM